MTALLRGSAGASPAAVGALADGSGRDAGARPATPEGGCGPQPPLDRFKLAGVIATWWTETLPDFKTLLENGFPGVMDGWLDAIADAVEDDEPPARPSTRSATSSSAAP